MPRERLNDLIKRSHVVRDGHHNWLTDQPDRPPVSMVMDGDNYCAVLRCEPFEFVYHWWSRDPNIALARVLNWYHYDFMTCPHSILGPHVHPTMGWPAPQYVDCEQCGATFNRNELPLLTVQ